MRSKRLSFLSVLLPAFAACRETPAPTILAPNEPLFAGVGMPRFTDASATGPDAFGNLSTSFHMAGMGSKASNLVTASAAGNAVWACQTGVTAVFDLYPAPETRAGTVSQSSGVGTKNGQVSGSVFIPSSAATIQCHPAHSLKLISTSFTGVQLSNSDAGSFPISGTFSQTYFTLPTDPPPPTITDVTVGSTTLTIGGQSEPVTVKIHNPGSPVSGVVTQLWIRQGAAFKAAGGGSLYCGETDVPTGDCTISLSVAANNASAGPGTLVPGAATFEVYLEKDNVRRVLDGRVINVTLQ
jgi:hypothetical protein